MNVASSLAELMLRLHPRKMLGSCFNTCCGFARRSRRISCKHCPAGWAGTRMRRSARVPKGKAPHHLAMAVPPRSDRPTPNRARTHRRNLPYRHARRDISPHRSERAPVSVCLQALDPVPESPRIVRAQAFHIQGFRARTRSNGVAVTA
jgi:hypothetical protein